MAIKRSVGLALVVLVVTSGVAIATHTATGLTTLNTWRGTMDRADLSTFAGQLGSSHRMRTSDLFVVRASLAAGGTTDWHGHTGPSIVLVTSGAIEVVETTPSGGCEATTYSTGEAFYHIQGAHTFNNVGTTTAEFLVTYFVPSGSPVTHPPAPAC